jgi:Berberine and berberine like
LCYSAAGYGVDGTAGAAIDSGLGVVFERLARVKMLVDPDNLFRGNHPFSATH